MSWGEVKKINSDLSVSLDKKLDSLSTKINSNLNVPLDTLIGNLRLNNSNVYLSDRIQYVSGIIPRGFTEKTVSYKKSGTSSYSGALLNISGRGALLFSEVFGNGSYDNINASMVITLDGTKVINMKTTNARSVLNITTDLTSPYSTVDLSSNNVTLDNSGIINYALSFSKSLKITANLSNNYNDSDWNVGASAKYILF